MSYIRVIPRDLFNEASLLKCLGKVYINLEILNLPHVAFDFAPVSDGEGFVIEQNPDGGSIYASNIVLTIGEGTPYFNSIDLYFYRPLNSREAWPLYTTSYNQGEIQVFDEDGNFTVEMVEFLKGN